MGLKKYEFEALRVTQGVGSPPLLLFSASAARVEAFAGIPQKRRIADGETVGFQRDVDPARIEALAEFYSTSRNVTANPLLCAIRQPEGVEVSFKAATVQPEGVGHQDHAVTDMLTIEFPDYASLSLIELFERARQALEQRVTELQGREDPAAMVQALRPLVVDAQYADGDDEEDDDGEEQDETSEDSDVSATAMDGADVEDALFEESHVTEFWDALRARELLLGKLVDAAAYDTFLGFSRSALGRIDIQRSQIMAAARWTKPVKWTVRRS